MAKTKKEKKEKKAGKRMKKKELVKTLLDFFHIKQDEVLSLKYIFEQLHLTTHPLKMLCMDILSELSDDDYITEVDKHKYKLNNHGVEMTGTFQRKSNGTEKFCLTQDLYFLCYPKSSRQSLGSHNQLVHEH